MKRIIFFVAICLFFQYSYSQDKTKTTNVTESSDNIKTTVITLDLSSPHSESVQHSGNKKRLVVKTETPLAFKLINGNPYRFRYVLNFNKVNLFTNISFDLPSIDPVEEDNTQDSNSVEGNTIGDQDGDGIPEGSRDDNCPNDGFLVIRDGCPPPPTGEEAKKVVLKYQNSLKSLLNNLENEIDSYISDISSQSKLDMEKFSENTEGFKLTFLKLRTENSNNETRISNLKQTEEELIIKNQTENTRILNSIKLKVKKLLSTSTESFLLPIDINGDNIDYVEVQLDIYDGDNETPETYTYKIWIRGGLKIDVSGGVHITSLFDNEYYTIDTTNGEKAILESNTGEYDFGFGTMINISIRGGSWVRPTLNFGALFTSNQKFQMLTGIGFILGKNERLIIHGGLSMGRVSVLRDNFAADGVTSYDLGTNGDIPLDNKFKFGHFFGITYNFGKPKSNKK